jgi:cytochrome c-type biogenesis protein CcmH/NrfG
MKKETIITAAIFLAVGFLAGYITDAQINWNSHEKAAQTAATLSEPPAQGATTPAPPGGAAPPQGLPEGHPPIDSAAIVKQLESMAAQNPKDPDVPLKLANFLYDQKQYAQSIEWYQRALQLSPKDVNARTDLGTAYFYMNRPQDALREYDKSLAIDPTHEQTLLNAIVVNLQGTHDLPAAEKAWARLYKQNPNHPALVGLKAQIDAARAAGSTAAPH